MPVSENGAQSVRGWPVHGAMLAGVLALILVLYRQTVIDLGVIWSRMESGPYGHGYLVLAMSGWLVYSLRKRILALRPCPALSAMPLLAMCVIAWSLAALVDVQLVQMVVLPVLMFAAVWGVVGTQAARLLLFPFLFVFFAIPVWSPLLPVLQEITAAGAFLLVRLFRVTAFLEGYRVTLPAGQLMIESACSGLNYLLAGIALGVFYASLHYRSIPARILVLLVVAGAAVLANVIRVFVIIYLAFETNMQHPFIQDHVMLGWYLFGAMMLTLLVIDHYLARRYAATESGNFTEPPRPCAGLLPGPVVNGVLVLVLACGPVAVSWLTERGSLSESLVLDLPAAQGGWTGPVPVEQGWRPEFHGAREANGEYRKAASGVLLYVGYYPQQQQGSELINDLNSIAGNGWMYEGDERVIEDAAGMRFREVRLGSPDGRQRLVWYHYRVSGHVLVDRLQAKLVQLSGLLTGRRDAAVIALSGPADRAPDESRAVMGDFLQAMEAELEALPGARLAGTQ